LSEEEQQQNNKPEVLDELKDNIKEEQQKEISYVLETSQADDKRSKFLAKKNEYKVKFDDGKTQTFKRKPLSVRKNKEIDDLRSAFVANQRSSSSSSTLSSIVAGGNKKINVNGKAFDNTNDILFEAYKLTAVYCLGMTEKQYDSSIWEDEPEDMDQEIYGLRSILTACLLRAVHGVAYFPQP
jgi:hypothetical protein